VLSTSSGYLRLRAHTTVRVPARSDIPAMARLGSTSGACGGLPNGGGGGGPPGGGGGGGPPGGGGPAKALAAALAPRASTSVRSANLTEFFIFLSQKP
jgi:hypothetical protein